MPKVIHNASFYTTEMTAGIEELRRLRAEHPNWEDQQRYRWHIRVQPTVKDDIKFLIEVEDQWAINWFRYFTWDTVFQLAFTVAIQAIAWYFFFRKV